MENKNRFNIFHTKTDSLTNFSELNASDFEPATHQEKESMVVSHKSVSYWSDAFRRFKRNTVSVIAFFVFIFIVLFAFVGPLFLPFDYTYQFRSSQNLKPMEYSEAEQSIMPLLEFCDAAYSTTLGNGSTLIKGNYFFTYKSKTYSFDLTKSLKKNEAILLDVNASKTGNVLYIISLEDFHADDFSNIRPLEVLASTPDGSLELAFTDFVFPHVFGTDNSGCDLMAQCMYGSRVSIIVGICAALIVLVIGAIYGSVSGLIGGTVDFVMMRIVDLIYSVPDVLIVLLLQVVLKAPLQSWFDSSTSAFVQGLNALGVGIVSIFITFALLYWVGMARLIRGQVLMLKKQEYVTAANALGVPTARIIKRHLLPNCVGQLLIATCLQIPSAIFLESFLSFLGLGVSAPMPSLGSLCSDSLGSLTLYPHRLLIPGIILSLLVLSLNLVGDGLRDSLDPRLKK